MALVFSQKFEIMSKLTIGNTSLNYTRMALQAERDYENDLERSMYMVRRCSEGTKD